MAPQTTEKTSTQDSEMSAHSNDDLQQDSATKSLFGGFAFRRLSIYGISKPTDYQKTFLNYPLAVISQVLNSFFRQAKISRKCILRDFECVVRGGEMLLVLGRPGSGCTTLLKTIAGDRKGLRVDEGAILNYGISATSPLGESRAPAIDPLDITMSTPLPAEHLHRRCIYSAESDVHFPQLTVSQTIDFGSKVTQPSQGLSRHEWKSAALESRKEIITSMGLNHTLDTKVGNDLVKGISGGERKRLSIAEVLLAKSPIQCWDNSTRGLDSANALRLVRELRQNADDCGHVSVATLYQISDDIYNCFDKVMLLYEGHEIFFGPIGAAKAYFEDLGFVCPKRSTTADFLCSVTDPGARVFRKDQKDTAPRSANDLHAIWKRSIEHQELLGSIQSYEQTFSGNFAASSTQSKYALPRLQWEAGPHRISIVEQTGLCVVRGWQRMLSDLPPSISAIVGNAIVSIILGSMFYDMPNDTSSFFGRSVLLFFTILTNTFLASFEGVQLWQQRPIVEKHSHLAFHRRSAEAIASMICDLPNKVFLTAGFNIPFYFLTNMRRTPAAFFTFYLFAFVSLLTGSMLYRTIGAMSQTLTASIAPGSTFILLLVIYTGFVIPVPNMHPWFRWFGYLNPVGYAFESLMINEFDGRKFTCASFLPQGSGYVDVPPEQKTCTVTGSSTGSDIVEGRSYLETTFEYSSDHLWRNLGIIFVFMIFLCFLYLLATEHLSTQQSRGELLVFPKSHLQRYQSPDKENLQDEKDVSSVSDARSEAVVASGHESKCIQAATFIWDDLSYEIRTKAGSQKLLNNVEGWVQPGTLTALMGASGAGKTTLLNVLADRVTIGTVSGEKVVDANFQNEAFARKVGYAQQNDTALRTTTIREALIFSARLRQSPQYSDAEKLQYVDEVIDQLSLSEFADAVIGVPGEGLNIEQRKRVTIGVELAARPELLLFLDEPTSGLDSNTAWSICRLLRKLADSGHAILCTIHQPSGVIFETFDKILLIECGQSVYFGDIGPDSNTILDYFHRNGKDRCAPGANPADWLLKIITERDHSDHKDSTDSPGVWSKVWASSPERRRIKESLRQLKRELLVPKADLRHSVSNSKYASSHARQLYEVTKRNFQQDWRTPSYLYSKIFLTLGAGIFNGFSFYMSAKSLQGIQDQIFSVFLLFSLHSSMVQLIMPRFLEGRLLYELVERPSRMYSWVVFVLSNVISELPSQTILSVFLFVTWYYPLGMYKNALATHALKERSGLMFLLVWSYFLFSSTFSQMVVIMMPDAATGINISALLYSLSLIFCGVLVAPNALPRFWIFMYRATPITYFVDSMVATGLAGVDVVCSAKEIIRLEPPVSQDCASYLHTYLVEFGGKLLNPSATQQCEVCPVSTTDEVIARIGSSYEDRWRNWSITLVYSVVNILGALFLYWLFRLPKGAQFVKR